MAEEARRRIEEANQYDLNDSFIDDRSFEEGEHDDNEVQWLMEVAPSKRDHKSSPGEATRARRSKQLQELSQRRKDEETKKRKKKSSAASPRTKEDSGTQRTILEQFSQMKEREERRKKRAKRRRSEETTLAATTSTTIITGELSTNTTTTSPLGRNRTASSHGDGSSNSSAIDNITTTTTNKETLRKSSSSNPSQNSQSSSSSSQDIRAFFVPHSISQSAGVTGRQSKRKTASSRNNRDINSKATVIPHSPSPSLMKPNGIPIVHAPPQAAVPPTRARQPSTTRATTAMPSATTTTTTTPKPKASASSGLVPVYIHRPSTSSPAQPNKITTQMLVSRIKTEPGLQKENLGENIMPPLISPTRTPTTPLLPSRRQLDNISQYLSDASQSSSPSHLLYQHTFQANLFVKSKLMPLFKEKLLDADEFASVAKQVSDAYLKQQGDKLLHKPVSLSPKRRDHLTTLLEDELRSFGIE